METLNYIVRGMDKDGNECVYTGKAGSGWVSSERSDAFVYQSKEVAGNKATNFNRMTAIHGLRFIAVIN